MCSPRTLPRIQPLHGTPISTLRLAALSFPYLLHPIIRINETSVTQINLLGMQGFLENYHLAKVSSKLIRLRNTDLLFST